MIIRNLLPSDTEIINFIKDRLSSRWKTSHEEIEEDYIIPSFEGDFPFIFVALTDQGEFAGKILVSIEENGLLGIKNGAWMSALFVPEKFRGQGIARKLIAATEDITRSRGYEKIYLDADDAVPYYHKIGGWDELGKDIWGGEKVTIMSRDLV